MFYPLALRAAPAESEETRRGMQPARTEAALDVLKSGLGSTAFYIVIAFRGVMQTGSTVEGASML